MAFIQTKRDNWTNEEIIRILESLKLKNFDHDVSHNDVIADCVDIFTRFLQPPNEMGAIALNMETQEIIHVGELIPSTN